MLLAAIFSTLDNVNASYVTEDLTVTARCIVACESAPPPGERAVEWRLLTNLPVSTLEQAGEMFDLSHPGRS
jgi:hypothetical protein